MVIVDTSVVIDHLRRPPQQSVLIKLFESNFKETFAVSVITIQELYEGKSTRDEVHENHLLSTLGRLEILQYNTDTARLAGRIARDSKNPVDFADAAIAATTVANGARLATLNQKHFKDIPELELMELQ